MKLTLGEKLKDERTKKKFTSKQVCEEIERRYGYKLSVGKYNEMESDVDKDFGYRAFIYLSKLFEVSVDYLLGLADNPSIIPDIQNACEVTGLSEDAVRNLIKAQKIKSSFFNPADEFIKCSDFDMFVLYIQQYITSILCTDIEYNDAHNKINLILEFMKKNQLSVRDMEVMGIRFLNNNNISLNTESWINNLIKDFLDKLTEKLLKDNPDLHDMRYYGIEKEE